MIGEEHRKSILSFAKDEILTIDYPFKPLVLLTHKLAMGWGTIELSKSELLSMLGYKDLEHTALDLGTILNFISSQPLNLILEAFFAPKSPNLQL